MKNKEIEKRAFQVTELRMAHVEDESTDSRTVEGYAATYGTAADLWGFKEYINRGAFTNSLINSDCRALLNHEASQLLAREKSGTLELFEDEKGLGFRFDVPESRTDVLEMVKRGDIDECSFAFTVKRQTWVFNDEEEKDERYIDEVEKLYDISLVTYPAYPNTSVSLRGSAEYEAAKAAYLEEQRASGAMSEIEIENANRDRSLRLYELQS